MTHHPIPTIHRRRDGSIYTAHYLRRGCAAHSAAAHGTVSHLCRSAGNRTEQLLARVAKYLVAHRSGIS